MDRPDSYLYWKETGGGERSNIEKVLALVWVLVVFFCPQELQKLHCIEKKNIFVFSILLELFSF